MPSSSRILLLVALFSVGIATEATKERQKLVGYWGQNSAGPLVGVPNYEKPLMEVCQTTNYDIINIAFLQTFWDTISNQDSLPALNFAHHCDESISDKNPTLLRCPHIEEGIKECQKRGKKVLLSIGGPTGDGTLLSPAKAKEFAWTLNNLFLGGDEPGFENLRPFGSAVLDGIDLDIEGGAGGDNYPYLIRELRRLMDQKTDKKYFITASPQCPYPDDFLGPEKAGSALKEAGKHVDYLFVQFYNNYCHTGDVKSFGESLEKWLSFSSKGPLIFVGLPAHSRASGDSKYYRSPSELKDIYERVKTKPGVGGIMLWDVSWDQNNVVDGKIYSGHVFDLLKDTEIVRTTTEAPTQGGTQGTVSISTEAPFSCEGKSDGNYPNPTDCSKYYMCAEGTKYERSCPGNLKFNPISRICDWPSNVMCG